MSASISSRDRLTLPVDANCPLYNQGDVPAGPVPVTAAVDEEGETKARASSVQKNLPPAQ